MATKAHRRRRGHGPFTTEQPQQAQAVTTRRDESVIRENWWWTISKRGTICHCCSESLGRGALIAYEHVGKRVLCESCADHEGVSGECRESRAARKARQS